MIQGQAYSFTPNPGYILYQASDLELASLREEVEQIAENRGQGWQSAQSVLVGSIEHEYHLTASRNDVFNLVLPLAHQYVREFNYQSKIDRLGIRDRGQPLELGLGGLWVNYQQKGEFNPVHQHDGVFSFVIWLQIPYAISLEQRQAPGQGKQTSSGDFHFHYTDTLGAIRTHMMQIDQASRNTICLFPAELHHVVYPYYSTQDLRISVSGNLHLAL